METFIPHIILYDSDSEGPKAATIEAFDIIVQRVSSYARDKRTKFFVTIEDDIVDILYGPDGAWYYEIYGGVLSLESELQEALNQALNKYAIFSVDNEINGKEYNSIMQNQDDAVIFSIALAQEKNSRVVFHENSFMKCVRKIERSWVVYPNGEKKCIVT